MALFNFKSPTKGKGKKKVIKPLFGYKPPVKKTVSKKNMNWAQAKAKHPKLSPFGDADKDGVKNWLDCKPFDRKRQDDKKRKELAEKHQVPEEIFDIEESDEVAEQYHEMFGY